MNNPHNQSSTEKISPLPDYVYPDRSDELSPPLSFFAFIAYLCLTVMHLLQFTDVEHFGGFYMDAVLLTLDPVAFVFSLLWVIGTLLALAPILIMLVFYLTDKEHRKTTTLILTVLHLCGIVLSIVVDFLIGGVPSVVSLLRWGFIGVLFFLSHYSKAKIYDLKNNAHAAMFMGMILFTLSFVFISFV